MWKIERYKPQDLLEITQLFYDTVHTVNARDYSGEQLDAWADGSVDLDAWNRSFLAHTTYVVRQDQMLVGFGDVDATGYVDRLYVHRHYQHQGVGTALCDALEASVGAKAFVTHASVTALHFFQKRGYECLWEQQVLRKGILLTNFVLRKPAPGERSLGEELGASLPFLRAFAQCSWPLVQEPARRFLLERTGGEELLLALRQAQDVMNSNQGGLDIPVAEFLEHMDQNASVLK